MSKKFVTSLLVGGATSATILIGSLKANSVLNGDEKIEHYKKLAASFSKYNLITGPKGGKYYLPEYSDDEAWERSYETKYKNHEEKDKPNFKGVFPDWKTFKKYCYDKAEKGDEKCDSILGWCIFCARNDKWDWDSQRNK